MPKKPAQPCDLRIAYAGNVFLLAPLSRRGREWLAEATDSDDPGPVEIRLRYLDDVLFKAHRAGMRLYAGIHWPCLDVMQRGRWTT
jgi:hypothetical protein